HLLDVRVRDALVRAAVKAQHGRLQAVDQIERVLRLQIVGRASQTAVPADPGLQLRTVCRVEPDDPAAVAEAGDTETCGGALHGFREGRRRVQVGHDLLV